MSATAHVAHVVQNLAIGGLERVVLDLATHVDRTRYRCSIVCLGAGGDLGEQAVAAGVPVRALAKGPGFRLGALARLARILRRERVALVHCHNTAPLVYGALAGRLAGAAGVVYTAHGMKTSGERKPVLLQRLGLVDHFVTVSEDARRIAVERAGAPAGRVATVLNGVDVAAFADRADPAARRAARAAMGVPADGFVFGIVARLSAAKDHARLFAAFAALAQHDARVRLVVVGDGERRADLETRVG
ncbi:MAG: glycosyltransferase, partial [Candidatus Krumholzibacteria bacterium]|nr:glycosyltransferase [Candidatus Krumholzibacteria bacterium]